MQAQTSLSVGTARATSIGHDVLVIGGAGFLGRWLVRALLERGHRVRSFDLQPCPEQGEVESLTGDLRDMDSVGKAVSGMDTVFHTAAVINLLGVVSARQRQDVFDINIGGTRNVVAACRAHGVKKLVYTSTNNVCFDREIVDGDEQCAYASRYIDLYTESKVEAEKVALGSVAGGELDVVALRPGGIWGPGPGAYMIEKFVTELASGKLVATLGDGSAVSDNTHVANLVDAQLLAAQALAERPAEVTGRAYFITDGEPMNPVQWFAPLIEALGYKLPALKLPGGLMYGLAYLLEWLHRLGGPRPLLTRMEVLKVVRTHSFRIDRARRELGYEPAIRSRDGLPACLPYCKEFVARVQG